MGFFSNASCRLILKMPRFFTNRDEEKVAMETGGIGYCSVNTRKDVRG